MHSFVKNRFKLMDIFWTFLPLVALSDPSFAVLIEMERLPSFPTDDFLLPDSLCPSFRPSCSLFRAHPLGGCWCSCPNTFSFYEGDFQCERNSEARRNAGIFCDLRLFQCNDVLKRYSVAGLFSLYLFQVDYLESILILP